MTDIADRLRKWVIAVDAVPVSDLMDEAAAEIDRLRLTDEERDAMEWAIATLAGVEDLLRTSDEDESDLDTLRHLLERLT